MRCILRDESTYFVLIADIALISLNSLGMGGGSGTGKPETSKVWLKPTARDPPCPPSYANSHCTEYATYSKHCVRTVTQETVSCVSLAALLFRLRLHSGSRGHSISFQDARRSKLVHH